MQTNKQVVVCLVFLSSFLPGVCFPPGVCLLLLPPLLLLLLLSLTCVTFALITQFPLVLSHTCLCLIISHFSI